MRARNAAGALMRPMLTATLTATLAATPAPPASAQDATAARQAAATITPELIRRHVYVLADDSMRGRKTPSPELELAAQYAASQFRSDRLRPGGDGDGFLQRYRVDQIQVLADSAALWTTGSRPVRWTYGVDYAPHPY